MDFGQDKSQLDKSRSWSGGPFLNSGAGLGPENRGVIFYNYLNLLIKNGGESGIRTRATF
jgi:hypothetical protein